MIHLIPDSQTIHTIQNNQGRYFWTAAFEIVLRKHGFIGIETATALDEAPDHIFLARETPLPADAHARPLLVESPMHEQTLSELGVEVKRTFSLDRLQIILAEEAATQFALSIPQIIVSDRSLPQHKRLTFAAKLPEKWRYPSIDVFELAVGTDWQPIWILQHPDGDIPIAFRREKRVIFGFGLFDVLSRRHTTPPLSHGYEQITQFDSGTPIENALIALIEAIRPPGVLCPVVQAWPAGYHACFTIRHDYDRSITDESVAALLEFYRKYGFKSSWFYLLRHVNNRQIREIANDGHEVEPHICPLEPTDAAFEREIKGWLLHTTSKAHGMTAHGGDNSAGYLGYHQIQAALANKHDYAEMLGTSYDSLPFAHIQFAKGFPRASDLICIPAHHSFEWGAQPEQTHDRQQVYQSIQKHLAEGYYVSLLNHPDIHRPSFVQLLSELSLDGVWRATMAEVARWHLATKHTPTVRHKGDEVEIELSRKRELPLTIAPCPNAKVRHTVPANAHRIRMDIDNLSVLETFDMATPLPFANPSYAHSPTDIAVQFKGVSLRYELSHQRIWSAKGWLARRVRYFLGAGSAPKRYQDFFVNLNFSLPRGEVVGILGRNGSGKTTLLRMIAGILIPHAGEIVVNGTVGVVLGIGAGFNLELSGRTNIYLNGLILGMTKREIDNKLEEMVAFAEIEDYIDQPVKYYSNGMISRLGFSIATSVKADIVLLDEVLSVGDIGFKDRAVQRLSELRGRANTQIIVSHSMDFIRSNCSKVIYIHSGQIKFYGDTETGIEIYEADMALDTKPES